MNAALRDALDYAEAQAVSTLTTHTRRADYAAKGGPSAPSPRGARAST